MFKHFDDQDISTEYSALMSKVMASGQQPDQDAHQRAGRGQEEEPNTRVPRLARQHAGRAAPRLPKRTTSSLQRRGTPPPRRRLPLHPRRPTTTIVWDRVNSVLRKLGHEEVKEDHEKHQANWASSSTPTTRGTCSNSSPNPSRTAPLSSSKSSAAAEAHRASAKATSRPSSKPSKSNRSAAGICEN